MFKNRKANFLIALFQQKSVLVPNSVQHNIFNGLSRLWNKKTLEMYSTDDFDIPFTLPKDLTSDWHFVTLPCTKQIGSDSVEHPFCPLTQSWQLVSSSHLQFDKNWQTPDSGTYENHMHWGPFASQAFKHSNLVVKRVINSYGIKSHSKHMA